MRVLSQSQKKWTETPGRSCGARPAGPLRAGPQQVSTLCSASFKRTVITNTTLVTRSKISHRGPGEPVTELLAVEAGGWELGSPTFTKCQVGYKWAGTPGASLLAGLAETDSSEFNKRLCLSNKTERHPT